MLENRLIFHNFHLKRMSGIYDEYNYARNIEKNYSKLPTILIEYKRRFDESFMNSKSLIRDYNPSKFNRRETENKVEEELHKSIQDYRKRMKEIELINFNKNISYLSINTKQILIQIATCTFIFSYFLL